MRLDLLSNRVLVDEIDTQSKVTAAGIAIPDIVRNHEFVSYGKVVAAGPGRLSVEGRLIPNAVKEGDYVAFPRKAPAVLPLVDGQGVKKDFLLMTENEVIGIAHDLPQVTRIAGLDGALLKMEPVSLARPDSAYKNIAEIDEAVADLKQSGAPPEVIAELEADHQDEEE
jgi:chaperonin GroES